MSVEFYETNKEKHQYLIKIGFKETKDSFKFNGITLHKNYIKNTKLKDIKIFLNTKAENLVKSTYKELDELKDKIDTIKANRRIFNKLKSLTTEKSEGSKNIELIEKIGFKHYCTTYEFDYRVNDYSIHKQIVLKKEEVYNLSHKELKTLIKEKLEKIISDSKKDIRWFNNKTKKLNETINHFEALKIIEITE